MTTTCVSTLGRALFGACVAFGTAAGIASTSRAEDISPPAKEWRSYCQSYMKAIDGDTSASDLDVTYCVGVTKGLLTGMRVGSQIGAVSFGSRIAVKKEIDPDEVFKLFQAQDPAHLLGICAPSTATMPDYVRPVLAKLDKNPGDAQRPIAEVFYEAVSAAYPCR
jgi:hypothetical protein